MWQRNQFLSLFHWLYKSHSQGHNAVCVLLPIVKGEVAKEGETASNKRKHSEDRAENVCKRCFSINYTTTL